MDRRNDPATDPVARVRRPLALTRAGLWAERLVRAFWPAWTVALLLAAVWASGLVSPLWEGSLLIALAGLAVVLAAVGARGLRAPTEAEARARLDATLPGRPLATLADDLAVGAGDAGARSVWRAHRARLAARLGGARPVAPDLRVSRRDPYALRYMALLLAAVALLFGTLLRVPAAPILPGGGEAAVAAGPAWEGWLEPPRHTGLPTLYLGDVPPGPLEVPEGTRVTLRLYGDPGALAVSETVSGRAETDPSAPMQAFEAVRSGTLAIDGAEGDPLWSLSVAPDAAPTIALAGEPDFLQPDTATVPWEAEDDHGIAGARVTFALDLPSVDRRHGLAVEPEAFDTIERDLALPIAGDRADIAETYRDVLTTHPLAGLPVTATFEAVDARGQTGTSVARIVLPAKPFYDPVAAALVEMRRDLLWSRDNRLRAARLLRAVTWEADEDGGFGAPAAYLITRMAIRRLDAGPLTPEARDEVADMLWEAATRLEEGSLDGALERLRQAQERLSEAIRDGASPEEIARLTQELRRAMDEYTAQLERQEGDEGQQQQAGGPGERQEVTPDMLDQMMERIEELMAQGRVAEAQELLAQLQEMMENLQVAEGGEGQGPPRPGQGGQQSMDEMRDALREQQELSDDAFRELQDRFDPGQQGRQGEQAGQGERGQQAGRPGEGGDDPDAEGEGRGERRDGADGRGDGGREERADEGRGGDRGEGTTPEALARRQAELRRQLGGLEGAIPEGEAGVDARDALDRAGRAMDRAEEDLRDGDLAGALGDQAEAMDALREGMQALGRALAGDDRPPEGGDGRRAGDPGARAAQDPLGRRSGDGARLQTEGGEIGGLDAARRAQELIDEIRRRAGERDRPTPELDYLRRLLDRF